MMESFSLLFSATVALTTLLAILVVWARRGLWVRVGAVVFLAGLLGVDYLALNDLLSRPKPVRLEFLSADAKEAQVLAAALHEGEAIYLWLRFEAQRQPRYYAMPWQRDTAQNLQEVLREAEQHRGRVMIRLPFEPSLEDRVEPRFYALPQTRLPLKPAPEVQEYRHPSTYT
jgi:hypothetical protein